jgi:amidohydrolase/aminoacylase
MFDGAAVENLMDCIETVAGFREAQFGKVKAGMSGPGEVVSVNPVYMNAGTPSPTVSLLLLVCYYVLQCRLIQQ